MPASHSVARTTKRHNSNRHNLRTMKINVVTLCSGYDAMSLAHDCPLSDADNTTMEQEIWKDVQGYEGLYQVSSLGRIRSLPRGKQWPYRKTHNNIRKPKLTKRGYYSINLCKRNKTKWHLVHRLVALAFIPNPDNLPHINHKDENPANNSAENLEWCTPKYNANYGTGTKRQSAARAANPNDGYVRKLVGIKNSLAVACYSLNVEMLASYRSMTDAAKATGVCIQTVLAQCKGYRQKARKYRFAYV